MKHKEALNQELIGNTVPDPVYDSMLEDKAWQQLLKQDEAYDHWCTMLDQAAERQRAIGDDDEEKQ